MELHYATRRLFYMPANSRYHSDPRLSGIFWRWDGHNLQQATLRSVYWALRKSGHSTAKARWYVYDLLTGAGTRIWNGVTPEQLSQREAENEAAV